MCNLLEDKSYKSNRFTYLITCYYMIRPRPNPDYFDREQFYIYCNLECVRRVDKFFTSFMDFPIGTRLTFYMTSIFICNRNKNLIEM